MHFLDEFRNSLFLGRILLMLSQSRPTTSSNWCVIDRIKINQGLALSLGPPVTDEAMDLAGSATMA
jgi:hypothetical protein